MTTTAAHMNRYWPERPDNVRIKQTGEEWARSMNDWFV
jgi:hypothetical protein